MDKSTLFEALHYLKNQGYNYVNAYCSNGYYISYDTAVTDYHEGYGNHEPGYLDWLEDNVKPNCEVDDYVFYYNGMIYYGNISKSDINNDISFKSFTENTEIDSRIGSLEKLLENEIDYPGIYAVAIWMFNLEKASDRIKSLEELSNGFDGINHSAASVDYYELYSLLFVDNLCWSDPEFVLGASELIPNYSSETLKYFCDAIDPSLKTAEFVSKILKNNPKMSAFFPAELNTSWDVAIDSIIEVASNFNNVSKKLSEDPEFIKEAWINNPKVYPFLPESMKADYDIAMGSLDKDANFYYSLPDTLKTDKQLVKIAMKKSGLYSSKEIFNSLPENIRRDEAFIREMMNDSINCYEFLDENLRNNVEFLKLNLQIKHSSCYQHIPQALKDTIKRDSSTLQQVLLLGASFDSFFNKQNECVDRNLIIQLLDLGIKIRTYNISEEFYADEELLLKLVKNNGGEIRNIPEVLQNKEEFILAAISNWHY